MENTLEYMSVNIIIKYTLIYLNIFIYNIYLILYNNWYMYTHKKQTLKKEITRYIYTIIIYLNS